MVNNGSDDGFLPDGAKPLPETILSLDCWYPNENLKKCSRIAGKNHHFELKF